MTDRKATAVSCANIAFIKYWGNRDDSLRLPQNGSISMNLDGLYARTKVSFEEGLLADALTLNEHRVTGPGLERVADILDLVREMAGVSAFAVVESRNNFPTGAGIASSAAAFSALALAASAAAGLDLPERELSRLARRGSGSACRSIPGGFVEWQAGQGDDDSYAVSIAPPEHWDLVDCIAILKEGHKPVGSTRGHALAGSSPLQAARLAGAPARLDVCRRAILQRDFAALAQVVERDSNLMHAVMMTSDPPLFYWEPESLALMKAVPEWRKQGWPVCYTLDAGPNVHVICEGNAAGQVTARLESFPGVIRVLQAGPGGPATLMKGS